MFESNCDSDNDNDNFTRDHSNLRVFWSLKFKPLDCSLSQLLRRGSFSQNCCSLSVANFLNALMTSLRYLKTLDRPLSVDVFLRKAVAIIKRDRFKKHRRKNKFNNSISSHFKWTTTNWRCTYDFDGKSNTYATSLKQFFITFFGLKI